MIRLTYLKGIDFIKTNQSHNCITCNYWYFLGINIRFQPKVYHGFNSLMQKAMSFNDAAILSIEGNDYRIHFFYMSKDEVINLLRHADLTEKRGI